MTAYIEGERARTAADAVAKILADVQGALASEPAASPSRAAEAALLCAYAGEAFPGIVADDRAEQLLERAIDALGAGACPMRLHEGVAGVAWIVDHLVGDPDDDPADDAVADIDELVLDHLARLPPDGDYDFVRGAVGLGAYGMARDHRECARRIVQAVAARMTASAVKTPHGLAWHTAAGRLPPHRRAVAPDGVLDVGMAHGAAGALAWLSALAGRIDDRASWVSPDLLAAVARFVVHWGAGDRVTGWLPASPHASDVRDPGGAPNASWCYGHTGVAMALELAGVALHDETLRHTAVERARALADDTTHAGLTNLGLCHGHAGVALLAGTMARRHDDDALRRAAARRLGELARDAAAAGPDDDRSLLSGSVGVALTLCWAVTGGTPGWAALLMMA